MVTPVFVCTGTLDSGKTTMVKDVLMEQEWIEPGRTLLIVCEEGRGRILRGISEGKRYDPFENRRVRSAKCSFL